MPPYKLLVLTAALTATACNSNNQDEQTTTKVDISTLHQSPVAHATLSPAQLEKLKFIYTTFSEVQPSTLEETITDFKRDQNPDDEIAIWMSMANAYQKFVQEKGIGLDLASKRGVQTDSAALRNEWQGGGSRGEVQVAESSGCGGYSELL